MPKKEKKQSPYGAEINMQYIWAKTRAQSMG